jgi:bifunctional oligoribonuclease and PAP phosphatase NrnA
MNMGLDIPTHRDAALRRITDLATHARGVVLTTHVNADGDGAGSEAAVVGWLLGIGIPVSIINPTAYPPMFRFLIENPDVVADAGSAAAEKALAASDVVMVLDTAETPRIGRISKALNGRKVAVIDHHLETDTAIRGVNLQDVTACATGELIYDLLVHAEFPRPWAPPIREGIYTAIVTDTGSFRFSNTSPRAHAIAGDLIRQGVDPELMYRRIYGAVPLRRMQLLRHALDNLDIDPEYPITSITIDRGVMEELGTGSDDLDGIVDHARSIEGTEVAILFRTTSDGATKISLRSSGAANVNDVARQFGGGGHIKASGALVSEPITVVKPRVIEATRAALRDAGLHFRVAREST